MKKYIPAVLVFVFFMSLSVQVVHAIAPQQAGGSTGGSQATGNTAPTQTIGGGIENPFKKSGVDTLQELFQLILDDIVIPIGGVLCVLAFIYSGFTYVMARGDKTKIEEAHRNLLYSAIGTAVLLGATVISKVITATVDQLK